MNFKGKWIEGDIEVVQWPFNTTKVLSLQWNPHKKTTFPPEFCNEIRTIHVYVHTERIILQKKKIWNVVLFQNCGQITEFYFASFQFWPKFEKPLSKGILQWNLALSRRTWIDLHYWNNILKTLYYICSNFLILHSNANLC